MEELRRSTAIVIIVAFLFGTAEGATYDSIRIAVGKISIKDASRKRGASTIELSDYIVLSLALRDTTFIPFKLSENSKNLKYDFKITGKGSLTESAFYASLTLVDKLGTEFPVESIYGKPSEFNEKLEKTLQLTCQYIKSSIDRRLLLKSIGFAVNKNVAGKNGKLPDEFVNEMANEVVKTFREAKRADVISIGSVGKSGDAVDEALLDKNKIDCLIYCDFTLSDDLSINVSPHLLVKSFQQAIDLPEIEIRIDADIKVFKKGISADFLDLFSFITKQDGSWNKENINLLIDVPKIPKDSLMRRSLEEMKKKRHFLSMIYAARAWKEYPNKEWYPQVIAINRYAQMRLAESLSFIDAAIAINSRSVFSHILKAEVAKAIPDYQLSMQELDIVEKIDSTAIDSEFGDITVMRGINYYFMDSINLAIRYLKNASRIGPKHSQFRNRKYYLAAAYYANRNFSLAIAELDDYLKYHPDDEPIRRHKGDIYADWGFDEFANGNYNRSWKLYKNGLGCGTTNYVSWSAALYPLNKLLRFSSADSLISVALKKGYVLRENIYNTNALILHDLALEGDPNSESFARKSIDFSNKHLMEVPSDAEAYAHIGRVYNSLKEFSRGTKALKEAIDLDGTNISYRLDLSEAYIMADRPKDASSILETKSSLYDSDSSSLTLMFYLKCVSNFILADRGETEAEHEKVMQHLAAILNKNEKIVYNWSYAGFEEWLATYRGKSKTRIEEITNRMKEITIID